MASGSVTYEVGITFCNGRSFAHGHETLADAMAEYATMLSVAIEPSLATEIDAKHIRTVAFLAFDELGQITKEIYSPVFDCEDRAPAA